MFRAITLQGNKSTHTVSPDSYSRIELMTTFNSGYYLNPEQLEVLAAKYQNAYRQAKPFPHTVIDNFLPANVLEQILDEFSTVKPLDWTTGDRTIENTALGKTKNKNELPLAAKTSHTTHWLLHQLSSEIFISFLEKLTSVEGLLPNPLIETDGFYPLAANRSLKTQADFACYANKLDRKLTLLIYLNKDWKEEYGGQLELWNAEMSHCEKKILPMFNRCVIFSTTDFSYHGHPEPLNCPAHETRKSLSLYYYGNKHTTITNTPTKHITVKNVAAKSNVQKQLLHRSMPFPVAVTPEQLD